MPRTLKVYGDLLLLAYPRSNSASNVIYFTDYFDPAEMGFVSGFLKPGDCFVDCGANIGTYSLLAASVVGPSGRVISYEPVAMTAHRLRENVEINRLGSIIDVRQVAVGAARGLAPITSSGDVSNTLVLGAAGSAATEEVEVVPVVPRDLPCTPRLIKVDVEGFEMAALEGMSEILRLDSPPVILIELTPHLLRRAGTSATQVASHLVGRGFSMPVAGNGRARFVPVNFQTFDFEMRQANYLAIPPAHAEAAQGLLSEPGPGR
ncbi:hypothetical protein N802_01160 [Knoellia sinensis KCTC 19936]|uniref:Methyltransferase FkbM domain-containing protein n=1 Tax=Knoellia sinensis KCTC 19936 TaxID=1385520 RepID=A0A0A0JCD1_9MICO|nr:FkbM family methyltransferase [Knoellia sinensis]KGN35010.1 hypothetical protein N802_01160 [Knoellia sinensis KCTC 19936]